MTINIRSELAMQGVGATALPRSTLLLVDGRPFVRDCLVRWLSGEMPDLEVSVVSDASGLPQPPDHAVPAMAMLWLTGRTAQWDVWVREQVELLRSRDEEMPIAVLVDGQDSEHAEALVETLGLQGHIPTSSSASVVLAALRLVLAGGSYMPRAAHRVTPRFAETLRPDRAEGGLGDFSQPRLTPREERVLDLLAKGLPNKIIAYRLGMSVSTVKVHVHHLIQKLRAQNRTELAILAPNFRASRQPMSGHL